MFCTNVEKSLADELRASRWASRSGTLGSQASTAEQATHRGTAGHHLVATWRQQTTPFLARVARTRVRVAFNAQPELEGPCVVRGVHVHKRHHEHVGVWNAFKVQAQAGVPVFGKRTHVSVWGVGAVCACACVGVSMCVCVYVCV